MVSFVSSRRTYAHERIVGVFYQLDYINNTALVQEWKLNIDAATYEKQRDDKVNRPSDKK